MSEFCGARRAHRTPRGGVDPIVDASSALAVIRLAISSPARDETILVVLGPDHRGRTILVVEGTSDDDAVVEVVERIADSMALSAPPDPEGWPGALVVASVRLGRGLTPEDADRWLEASAAADAAGVELLEWFVVQAEPGRDRELFTAWCARDLLAEPPRWPAR